MFIPISDANPLRHLPYQYVTLSLVGLNVLAWLVFNSGAFGEHTLEAAVTRYGMIPSLMNDYEVLPPGYRALPEWATLLTYQFLHADILHLGANMAFLWVFGDNVEDAMGHLRFLVFYLLCGVLAGLVHSHADPGATAPLIGASGAVAGVIGAYLVLHPRVKVWVLVLWRVPLRLSALWVLGFWGVMQVYMLVAGADSAVAWWAHVGGMAAGAVLVIPMRRRGVPLFDRGLVATPSPRGPARRRTRA